MSIRLIEISRVIDIASMFKHLMLAGKLSSRWLLFLVDFISVAAYSWHVLERTLKITIKYFDLH